MANPKLLASITVPTGGWDFVGDDGSAFTATIPAGEYDSILELLGELEGEINAEAGTLTFTAAVSSLGIVTITATNAWTVTWATTNEDLVAMLGFAGDETVSTATLTATYRHHAAWYSPVLHYHAGTPRSMARRLTPTGDGAATVYGASEWHKRRVLRFQPLLESQLDPDHAEVADDGASGTVDWSDVTFLDFWKYVNARKFRVYEDGADGTVADAGDDGVDYYVAIREGEEVEAYPIGGEDLTWWSIEMPVLIMPPVAQVDPA